MKNDEQAHVALPKLYGAPAYARPKVIPVAEAPKPFDPDELPLTAYQTPEERDWTSELPARAYQPGGGVHLAGDHATMGSRTSATTGPWSLLPRPFRIRALAGRFLGSGEEH